MDRDYADGTVNVHRSRIQVVIRITIISDNVDNYWGVFRRRDIVITGLQPWDIQIGSNCKNLAVAFSKHNRVLRTSQLKKHND